MNLYEIEHLTKDNQGYVYWKNTRVEHYSYSDKDRERIAAENLAADCRLLESDGVKVSPANLGILWQKREMDKFPPAVRHAAVKIAGSYNINGICDIPYIADVIMSALRTEKAVR